MSISRHVDVNDSTETYLLPVVEVWSGRKLVPDSVYNRLVETKPSPCGYSREQKSPITGKPRGVDFWRFELGGKTTSKMIPLRKLVTWATKHKMLLKAAKAAGCKCTARIEVFPEHSLYSLPLSLDRVAEIQATGLGFTVVWHSPSRG